MSLLGHERRFRDVRDFSTYPWKLAARADIPDRLHRAESGCGQQQHIFGNGIA
jgi:hypothetical protein